MRFFINSHNFLVKIPTLQLNRFSTILITYQVQFTVHSKDFKPMTHDIF